MLRARTTRVESALRGNHNVSGTDLQENDTPVVQVANDLNLRQEPLYVEWILLSRQADFSHLLDGRLSSWLLNGMCPSFFLYKSTFVCPENHTFPNQSVCLCKCKCECVCMCVCVYMCMYTCGHLLVCVYLFVYTSFLRSICLSNSADRKRVSVLNRLKESSMHNVFSCSADLMLCFLSYTIPL